MAHPRAVDALLERADPNLCTARGTPLQVRRERFRTGWKVRVEYKPPGGSLTTTTPSTVAAESEGTRTFSLQAAKAGKPDANLIIKRNVAFDIRILRYGFSKPIRMPCNTVIN